MKTKQHKLLLLTGLLVGSVFQAQAQNANQREDVSAERQLVEQVGGINGVTITPATIVQVSPFNQAILQQVGSSNSGQIVQQGASLSTTIMQNGIGNTAVSNVTGNGTTSNILQQGDGNSVDQQLQSVGQRTFTIQQYGNSNALQQVETGQSTNAPAGYGVKMEGNGIRIQIQQGTVGTMP